MARTRSNRIARRFYRARVSLLWNGLAGVWAFYDCAGVRWRVARSDPEPMAFRFWPNRLRGARPIRVCVRRDPRDSFLVAFDRLLVWGFCVHPPLDVQALVGGTGTAPSPAGQCERGGEFARCLNMKREERDRTARSVWSARSLLPLGMGSRGTGCPGHSDLVSIIGAR